MRMPELKSLARDSRLKGYSRMRKAELVALLQNSPHQARAAQAHLQLHQLKLGNLQMIGDRGSLVHKKWIYLN